MANGENKKISRSHYVVILSVLIAFVLVFQLFGSYIKIGATTFSFVLVPIVLGGILLGVTAGAILGLVFAVVITVMGFTGVDAFTSILLNQALVGTLITIFLKGVLAGAVPALVYKLIAKRNDKVALFVASALAPLINTGVFIVCMLFMSDVLTANFVPDGSTVIYFLVIGCAGVNFLIEFAINVLLAPAIERVLRALGKNKKQNDYSPEDLEYNDLAVQTETSVEETQDDEKKTDITDNEGEE